MVRTQQGRLRDTSSSTRTISTWDTQRCVLFFPCSSLSTRTSTQSNFKSLQLAPQSAASSAVRSLHSDRKWRIPLLWHYCIHCCDFVTICFLRNCCWSVSPHCLTFKKAWDCSTVYRIVILSEFVHLLVTLNCLMTLHHLHNCHYIRVTALLVPLHWWMTLWTRGIPNRVLCCWFCYHPEWDWPIPITWISCRFFHLGAVHYFYVNFHSLSIQK